METKAMNIYNNEVLFKDVMESTAAMIEMLEGTGTATENAARDFKDYLAFAFSRANAVGKPIGNIEEVIEEAADFTNLLNQPSLSLFHVLGRMYFLNDVFSSVYEKQKAMVFLTKNNKLPNVD